MDIGEPSFFLWGVKHHRPYCAAHKVKGNSKGCIQQKSNNIFLTSFMRRLHNSGGWAGHSVAKSVCVGGGIVMGASRASPGYLNLLKIKAVNHHADL